MQRKEIYISEGWLYVNQVDARGVVTKVLYTTPLEG